MRASKHLVTLDKQPDSLTTSVLYDPAVGNQLLQHHYGIPIDVVDTDAPPALTNVNDDLVVVPPRLARSTRSQNSAGAAGGAGSTNSPLPLSEQNTHTQPALKPALKPTSPT
eukprot:3758307-Rhodomonas_salina.1